MSLCIAAAAEMAMVLCFDYKVSTDILSSETEVKFFMLPSAVGALISGDISLAHELLDLYSLHLAREQTAVKPGGVPSTMTNRITALEELRIPPRIVKRRMIEAHVQARLGISYDDFLRHGKNQIDSATRRQITNEIYQMQMNVELLLCGFISPGVPASLPAQAGATIFRFSWEKLDIHNHFACIGAGATAAELSLHRRGQNMGDDIALTLYNVFEAKRLAEQSPSVGTETMLVVVCPLDEGGMRMRALSGTGLQFLEQQFKKYGPQELPTLEFPEEGFKPQKDFKI